MQHNPHFVPRHLTQTHALIRAVARAFLLDLHKLWLADSKDTSKSEQQPQAAPRQQASSKIGPAALHLLNVYSLQMSDITPTGPQGIILKGDVLAVIEGGPKQPAQQQPAKQAESQTQTQQPSQAKSQLPPPADQKAQSDRQLESAKAKPAQESQQARAGQKGRRGRGVRYTDIPNSQMRKIIAQRLQESKQTIPSLYVTATADIDAVSALRQQLKDQGKKVCCPYSVQRAVQCSAWLGFGQACHVSSAMLSASPTTTVLHASRGKARSAMHILNMTRALRAAFSQQEVLNTRKRSCKEYSHPSLCCHTAAKR